MNWSIFLFLCSTLASVNARGCLYYFGVCVEICPDGSYGYNIGCDYLLPEPTCRNPFPQRGLMKCDFSACYCDPPTVRDEISKKCVPLKHCPGITPVTPKVPVTPWLPVTPRTPRTPVTPRVPITRRVPLTPRVTVIPRIRVTPNVPINPCVPVPPLPEGIQENIRPLESLT